LRFEGIVPIFISVCLAIINTCLNMKARTRFSLFTGLLAAVLFGAATPASKPLLNIFSPIQLAGLLYLGAAVGVLPLVLRDGGKLNPGVLDRKTISKLLGAILFGGILGPVFLLFGLHIATSASVSLWLNLEMVATIFLGFFLFRDRLTSSSWIAASMILAASILLSYSEGIAGVKAGLLVFLGCLCWGFDNHFTALIDGITPAQTTFYKGIVAGIFNVSLGMILVPYTASATITGVALLIGVFAYGLSIVLYITSAQQIGATRSQILFSTSPFFGVLLSALFLGENLVYAHFAAMILIAVSICFLTFEKHSHKHSHHSMVHRHWHRHDDDHHDHVDQHDSTTFGHSHKHEHSETNHNHPHLPDLHHRHEH